MLSRGNIQAHAFREAVIQEIDPKSASARTGWTKDAACEQCSLWADTFNGIIVHLNHRDVTMLAVSRGPYRALNAYKERMG